MATLSPEAQAIIAYVEPRLDRYLSELDQLCAIDTPSGYAPGSNALTAWVRRWVGQRGWDIQEWPDDITGAGFNVTARGGNTDGLRLLLLIHHDTIYPIGTAAERPRVREGNRLLGPGVIDAKSGVLSSLYAMDALDSLDLLTAFSSISLASTPDEEDDMRVSKIMLNDLAPHYDVALSVEAATPDGRIVSARKGGATYTLSVTGKAAHAMSPEKGANAISALAAQIVAIQSLNAFRPEVTVNVGIVSGGTANNVVPAHASAEVDVRMTGHEGDVEAIEDAMNQIGGHPYVPGATSTVTRDLYFPPMPATPRIVELAELAVSCASDFGISLEHTAWGGITLANLIAGEGVPTLDGLGAVGGGEHGIDEYVEVDSIVPRIALLAHFAKAIADRFSRHA